MRLWLPCAPPIQKEELRIDWKSPAKNIINKIRAFDPAPGAWCMLGGRGSNAFGFLIFLGFRQDAGGEVVGIAECGLIVAGGCGRSLCIGELQMEGQRRMRAYEFTRGRPISQRFFSGMTQVEKTRNESQARPAPAAATDEWQAMPAPGRQEEVISGFNPPSAVDEKRIVISLVALFGIIATAARSSST